MLSAKELKSEYINWYKQNLKFESLNDNLIRIDSPFKDNTLGDIVLYAEKNPNDSNITLTDDGYTMYHLELTGVDITRSNTRQFIVKKNFESYGVTVEEHTKELYI